ncbi:MAG: TIGR03087 family PEP-CTERM/XrtA system glycosyltransferase [Planctomycetota bacterium]
MTPHTPSPIATHATPNAQPPGRAAARRKRVLLLTHRLPFPPDRGDRIRSYHLLKALARFHDVTLGTCCDAPPTDQQIDGLRLHADIIYQRIRPMRRRACAARALLQGRAATPAAYTHPGLIHELVQTHLEQPFDVVVTFCTGMAHYAEAIQKCGGQPVRHVLDLVDVDSAKWARYAKAGFGPMRAVYAAEARQLRRYEAGRVVHADAISVISRNEARVYERSVTCAVTPTVAGNGVDMNHYKPAPPCNRPVCVFTGVMSYRPNAEAVNWFARRVFPQIRAKVSGARFVIVGKDPGASVRALHKLQGVRVVGAVPDVRPYLHSAAVSVAPMRIAPGVQNKVLEAMACGRPVVCTPQAARGIDAVPGEHLLTAHGADAFCDTVTALLRDPGRAATIAAAARERVETHYTWHRALAPLVALVDAPVQQKPAENSAAPTLEPVITDAATPPLPRSRRRPTDRAARAA